MTDLQDKWQNWAREIAEIAQEHSPDDVFQHERSEYLLEIADAILDSGSRIKDFLSNGTPYIDGAPTVRLDVRGAVFRDGEILMVREARDGNWTLPGGWTDVGDAPAAAAEREVWEEAGFYVRAVKLIGVYDTNRGKFLELSHAYKLIFLCEIIAGAARPSFETSAVKFFAHDMIPSNFSGERTRMRHIQDAFAAAATPNWRTVFD
ncbi:MAG: NUDIX domain-containing protein [Anaerolineales bacterium]|nr:NUDIX domain-containing protein [Anaerolineales bacterium]